MPTKPTATKARIGKPATATKKAAKPAKRPLPSAKKTAAKPAPRADKGDGDAAVQARIKVLAEPMRSIMVKLHPLVRKYAPTLLPTVRYGFAVYQRDGKMLLVASPYTKHVSFGFTGLASVKGSGPKGIKYTSADDVDEAQVAAFIDRL